MTNGRKLRSKDDLNKSTDKTLFNFESINKLVHRNQKIKIVHDPSYDNLFKYFGDTETTIPTRINRIDNIETCKDTHHRRSKHKVDILDDSIYELFHKKMKKEERSMANVDRSRILTEVDNLNTLLQILGQHDWVRHLPNITYINNARDYDELETKKDLTIREIQRILNKFENWKGRQEKLFNDIREHDSKSLDGKDRESDFLLPIEFLKERNLKERRKEIGPTIKLNLRNGYVLVIEPFVNPRIDKFEDTDKISDRKMAGKRTTSGSFSKSLTNSRPSHRGKHIESLDTEHNELNFQFDERNNIAFGVHVPDIKQNSSFSLNSYWRLQAQQWKNGRKQLRRKLRK